jgi:hypothetical protein
MEGAWLFKTDYERNLTERSGYENTLSMGVSFQPNSSTDYNLLLTGGDASNRQINLNLDKKLNDDLSITAGFGVGKTLTSGYNNTVEFSVKFGF